MGTRQDLIDAYAVLGVSPRATQNELKAAHRRLVRRHHPDLAPPPERAAATERVQRVNVAYGLVRDEARRADYDRLRLAHRGRQAVVSVDAELARRWERLLEQAGKWAGSWWASNRRAVERSAVRATLAAGRAGRELFARLLWVSYCLVGALLGTMTALSAGQVILDGVVGALTPVAGALAGVLVGSDRGRRRRHRIARLPPPRRPWPLAPLAAVTLVMAAIGIDALFSVR